MKKRTIFRFILIISSIVFFMRFIVWGDRGVLAYYKLKNAFKLEQKEVSLIDVEVKDLEYQISKFNDDDFYKEKMAREEHLLGGKNELVYVLE